jgi:hypothetical protein
MLGFLVRYLPVLPTLSLRLLLLMVMAQAANGGGPPYGIPSGVMPWEYW